MSAAAAPPSLLRALRPEVQNRLYDFYDTLRAAGDCHWDRAVRAWIVTSYEAVSAAAGDSRLSSVRYPDLAAVPEELRPLARVLDRQMLYSDPPDHLRLRALVSRAFTPRAAEALRQQITATVEQMIANALPHGRMEIVADLAYPLPVSVICDLLQVPESDRARLTFWSAEIATVIGNPQLTPEQARAALDGTRELLDYFRLLAAQQSARGERSVLVGFRAAEVNGTHLTEDELLANAVLMLLAGHETTTHFLGNAMLALLTNPEQLRRLIQHPDRIPAAVEELLRFDSPVQVLLRRATQELEIGGRTIATGEVVLLLTGAANRDPAAFADPHSLDLERSPNRHVAFGNGPHFCLGAGLARLEGEIAVRALITHLPQLRLADDRIERHRSLTFRGLTRLEVAFTPVV